jgi:Bacterial TSP3 repeat
MPSQRSSSGKAAKKPARYDPLNDDDKDGIKNFREHELGTNHRRSDTDGDGINDAKEVKLGTDPTRADTDGDGLSDKREVAIKTNPHKRDSDGDGINDREELQVGTDPKVRTEKAEYRKILDTDGDGLTDDEEARLGTDPKNFDTDGDHWLDSEEVQFGWDPLNPAFEALPKDFRQELDMMDAAPDSESKLMQAPASPSADDAEPTFTQTSMPDSGIDADLIEMDSPSVRDFLRNASHQLGDKHKRMAEADPKAKDPDTWDSSELVEWSAKRAGVTMPDGSWKQYDYLAKKGSTVSVEEALRTPGALVFTFPNGVSGPGGSRPTGAGVGISMGDGRVMEVRQGGEVMLTNDVTRYTHAGVMEEFTDAHNPGSDASSIVDVVTGERYADALTGGPDAVIREWPPLVIPPKDLEPGEETTPDNEMPNAGDPPDVEVPIEVPSPADDELPGDDEEPGGDEGPADDESTEPGGVEDGQPAPEPEPESETGSDEAPADPFADSDGDGPVDLFGGPESVGGGEGVEMDPVDGSGGFDPTSGYEDTEMAPTDLSGSVDEAPADPPPVDSLEPMEEPAVQPQLVESFAPIEEPSFPEPEPSFDEANDDGSLESI